MRAGALTEATRRTPPPLPNKINPTLEEMSHERDTGPSSSGKTHSSPLSTIELQQGKSFTPGTKIGGVVKQCCVRCNSHANGTCQGAKTYLWHNPAATFPDIPLNPSVSALMVPFGGASRSSSSRFWLRQAKRPRPGPLGEQVVRTSAQWTWSSRGSAGFHGDLSDRRQ